MAGSSLKNIPELFRILSKGKGLADETGEGLRNRNINPDEPPLVHPKKDPGSDDAAVNDPDLQIDPKAGDDGPINLDPDPDSFDPDNRPFERDQGTASLNEAGRVVRAAEQGGPVEKPTTNINPGRLDTEKDIHALIDEASQINASKGLAPPRDTLAGMEERAEDFGLKDIIGHDPVKDGIMLPEKAVGARNLLVELGEQLYQEAKQITRNSLQTTDEQLFIFRQNISKYRAVLAVVEGQTRLAGQLLGSFRIPAKATGKIKDLHVANLLEEMGGPKTAVTMAKTISEQRSLNKLSQKVKGGWMIKTIRRAEQMRYNSMLSGVNTHLRNFIGNSAAMMGRIVETPFAAAVGKVRKTLRPGREVDPSEDFVRASEVMVQILSLPSGMWDGLRLAGKALRDPDFTVGGRKTFDLADRNWSMRKYAWSNANPVIRSMAFLVDVGLLNGATRTLNAGDSLFKGIAYRMEKSSLAWRRAMNEGHSGEVLMGRVEDLMNHMPAEDYIKSIDEMHLATFTNRMQGETLRDIQRAINRTPGASLAVPFFGTLVNLASWTMRRTPMAPLTPSFWRAVREGGIQSDRAFGQAMAGTVLVAAPVWQMVREKRLTGSGSFLSKETKMNWIKAGWRPNAILDKNGVYHDISGAAPMATLMLTYATIFEAAGFIDDEQARTDLWLGAAFMFGEIALDQTFARGLADWIDAIADPEPWKSSSIARQTATSFSPAWLRTMRAMIDPVKRETNLGDFSERLTAQFMNQIPGLSDSLPPAVNYFGELSQIGYDVISVFPESPAHPDMHLYHHLDRNGYEMKKPKPILTVAGQSVDLNKDMSDAKGEGYVYHWYQKFLGQARRDIVNATVATTEFQNAPEGIMGSGTPENPTRGDILNKTMRNARGAALQKLADRYGSTELEALIQQEMDNAEYEVHPVMPHIQRDRELRAQQKAEGKEPLNLSGADF